MIRMTKIRMGTPANREAKNRLVNMDLADFYTEPSELGRHGSDTVQQADTRKEEGLYLS